MEKTKQATRHTPEPWLAHSGSIYRKDCPKEFDNGNRLLMADRDNPLTSPVERDSNIHHATACVNALAGVGDPKSYSVAVRELIEAAEGIFALKGFKRNSGLEFTRLRTALAAVKGSNQ